MKFLNATVVLLGLLFIAPDEVYSETYAVLYNALSTAYNWRWWYSFEASTARFYHILHKNGIPKKNIITVTPEAAAYHPKNPYPGVLLHNSLASFEDAPVNYYENFEVDYNPEDFTPDLLYQIMAGNITAAKQVPGTGRVLKGGPKDTLVVYFSSISYPGVVLFNIGRIALANEFIRIFEKLDEEKRFGKIKLILDVDYPGTFLDDYLDKGGNILGYTISPFENDVPDSSFNEHLQTYTSRLSNALYLQLLETTSSHSAVLYKYSLHDFADWQRQWAKVMEIPDYTPNLHGRLEIANEPISLFYGSKDAKSINPSQHIRPMELLGIPPINASISTNEKEGGWKIKKIISNALNHSETGDDGKRLMATILSKMEQLSKKIQPGKRGLGNGFSKRQ